MILFEQINVYGFEAALRGMRNPLNSWNDSDSKYTNISTKIGPKDMKLMIKLAKGGTEHRKYLRMIGITLDVTAPLYWWKEFDTYKVGTAANSCSTMHKIDSRDLLMSDFSIEHLTDDNLQIISAYVDVINSSRKLLKTTKDKLWWWQMIQLLPSSYNQKRTIMLNYEVGLTILKHRSHHKLDEWIAFCEMLMDLPYMNDLFEAVVRKEQV